jgi:GNAT superfamily N-acetyltransferase
MKFDSETGEAEWIFQYGRRAPKSMGTTVARLRGGVLRIAPVTEEDAAEFGRVIVTAFGTPDTALSQMIATSVGMPNSYPYAAWDGDTLVAGGVLLVHGDVGALHSGSTLPGYRRRGAQSALIAARAEAARESGCRWLFAETGRPTPDQPNRSYNNMRRSGLDLLYERKVWRWTSESTGLG